VAKRSLIWRKPVCAVEKWEKCYQFAEGPAAPLLRLVLRELESIPAIDTFVEQDWRIKRDTVNGVRTVRVLTGYESPEGKLDAEQTPGYWFRRYGVDNQDVL
jgi:hypothetical protein